MTDMVEVRGLVKRYDGKTAVAGIDFSIFKGEIFGLLGPNGAGKTSTIEIIEGLRRADDGLVRVSGCDPQRHEPQFRRLIGVQLQNTVLFPKMKVREALHFFCGLYDRALAPEELAGMFGLEKLGGALVKDLSGGEKQRLAVALAFANDPQIVFLDEPTTGMDPNARRDLWEIIGNARAAGKTFLLTTHYMEEAQALCDRVAIMDEGRIVALDSPRELIVGLGADKKIEFLWREGMETAVLADIPAVKRVERVSDLVVLYTAAPQPVLLELLSRPETRDWRLDGLRVSDASLDDVYVALTGRRFS